MNIWLLALLAGGYYLYTRQPQAPTYGTQPTPLNPPGTPQAGGTFTNLLKSMGMPGQIDFAPQVQSPPFGGSVPSPTGKPLSPFQDFAAYRAQMAAMQAIQPQCPAGMAASLKTDPQTGAMSWSQCLYVPLVQ